MERMTRDSIKRPVNELGKPDWAYMHAFMAGLSLSRLPQLSALNPRDVCPSHRSTGTDRD